MLTLALAKQSKSFSLVACISLSVDQMLIKRCRLRLLNTIGPGRAYLTSPCKVEEIRLVPAMHCSISQRRSGSIVLFNSSSSGACGNGVATDRGWLPALVVPELRVKENYFGADCIPFLHHHGLVF